MAEYIEREVVLAAIDCEFFKTDPDGAEQIGVLRCRRVVRELLAADVAPVVHSKWKYYHKQGKAVCMNCSFERGVDDNFGRAVACPNCGARMDGE